MAQDKRKIEFRTQGSVAYDPSFYVGEEQAAEVKAIMRAHGMHDAVSVLDTRGVERVVKARK